MKHKKFDKYKRFIAKEILYWVYRDGWIAALYRESLRDISKRKKKYLL